MSGKEEMMRKNASNNDEIVKESEAPHRPATLSAPVSSGGIRLGLPPGKPDRDALRSATREWLVPLLVEKFLRLHGVELRHSSQQVYQLQPSLLGQSTGTGAKPRRSQAKKKNHYQALK